MKIVTVFAAALAAGLTTFAASANDTTPKATDVALKADRDTIKSAGQPDKSGEIDIEGLPKQRGLSAEEVLQAAKAFKADKPNLAGQTYQSIVVRHAMLNGVPRALALAVVAVESNYKPNSRGRAGEVGLMQIKPATAKLMGYSGSITGLFDPETNIKYGMKYLAKAHRLGGGTTCGTILKYNAGHGAKRMNPISRNYCNKVKRHLDASAERARTGRGEETGV